MLRQSVNPEIVQVYEAGCCESRAEDVGFFYLLGWEWVRFALYTVQPPISCSITAHTNHVLAVSGIEQNQVVAEDKFYLLRVA
jgi:hypothetical protein